MTDGAGGAGGAGGAEDVRRNRVSANNFAVFCAAGWTIPIAFAIERA
ncbi:hypothetical protein [Stakelama saccharophila]|uniref:Uncharacterized protein n=1 Tax=Stakelama saccharophila TaxID=3075605 RepID=A0ABZ0B8L4_9SPHN|nr:hypothetical protein [Stakelama sp. W311]WNO52644.1 hypothetical protein RPR59_09205 [Stakelama sp. W311]